MAVAGFFVLAGPLGPARAMIFPQPEAQTPQGFAHALASLTALPPLAFALPVGLGLLWLGLSHAPLRENRAQVGWGILVGLTLASAFVATSLVNDLTFDAIPVEGFSFTATLGRTLLYLMTASAGGLNFAVGSVMGIVAGAAMAALWRRRFRWEACEDPRELGRQVAGACLMGAGGVLALGCSIGQGASAMATLAFSAPLVFASIVAGALVGLRQLLRGFQQA
jgi:hypothetical protein